MARKLFIPVIDNGMGLSRTSWAVCLAAACLGVLRRYDVILQPLSSPYPAGNMNIASNDFLASGADEMLVIDTDLRFECRHIEMLMEHDEPLVFGLYPKKVPGLHWAASPLSNENPFDPSGPPLVEMRHMARGFMRMHRSVLETLIPHVPQYVDPYAEDGNMMHEFWKTLPGDHSEDFEFCDRWRSLGGRVLVDQRVVVQHEGSAVFPIPGTF